MDVSSMLSLYALNAGSDIEKLQKISEADNKTNTKVSDNTTDSSASFSGILGQEISALTETSNLTAALDKTVLKGVTDSSDLSAEMLRTTSGQAMMQELMKGQFASIITADSEDDDEEDSTDILDSLTDSTTAANSEETTLEALLERMQTLVDNLSK